MEESSKEETQAGSEASQPEMKLRIRKLSKNINFPPSLPESVLRRGSMQSSNHSSPRSSKETGSSGFNTRESEVARSSSELNSLRGSISSSGREEALRAEYETQRTVYGSPRQSMMPTGSAISEHRQAMGEDPRPSHALFPNKSPRSDERRPSLSSDEHRVDSVYSSHPSRVASIRGASGVGVLLREKTNPVKPLIRSISLDDIFNSEEPEEGDKSSSGEGSRQEEIVELPDSSMSCQPSEPLSMDTATEVDNLKDTPTLLEMQNSDRSDAREADQLIAESSDPSILEEVIFAENSEEYLGISNESQDSSTLITDANIPILASEEAVATEAEHSSELDSIEISSKVVEDLELLASRSSFSSKLDVRDLGENITRATDITRAFERASTEIAQPDANCTHFETAEDTQLRATLGSQNAGSRRESTKLVSVAQFFGTSNSPFDTLPSRDETQSAPIVTSQMDAPVIRPSSVAPIIRPVVAPLPGNLFGAAEKKPVIDPFSAPPPEKFPADPLSPSTKRPTVSAVDVFSRQPPLASTRDPSLPPAPPGVTMPSRAHENPHHQSGIIEKKIIAPKPLAAVPVGMIPTPHGYVPLPQASKTAPASSLPSPIVSPREETLAPFSQHTPPSVGGLPPVHHVLHGGFTQGEIQPRNPFPIPQQMKPAVIDVPISQRSDRMGSSSHTVPKKIHSKNPPSCSFVRFGFGGKVAVFHPRFNVSAGLQGLDERK